MSDIKKFSEIIDESVQPCYAVMHSDLNKFAFDIFENAKTKEDVCVLVREFSEKLNLPKPPIYVPPGAMM